MAPIAFRVSDERVSPQLAGCLGGPAIRRIAVMADRRTLVRSTERDQMSTTLDNHLLDELESRVTGSVLAPDHADYDAVRAVHNGLVDRKPVLIVRARDAQDVVAALAFARSGGFQV
jgi:hypothetical protein